MDWREREKNKERNRESPSLSPLPHPLVVSFFCSHLYELSPRSERLEQARHQAAPNHSSPRKWVIAWDQTKRSRVMGSFRETKNPEQPPGIMPRRAVRLCAQIISRTPMVWHFIEYPRQDVCGENMYVCLGAMIWIWTPIVHGFALPIGMVLKSAMELIYHLSFLGVKTEKCEFYTAQRQLRILVPKGTLRLTQKMKCQLSRLTWTLEATVFHQLFPFVMLRRKLK